ncbi:hypothetical protein [Parvibaculum sp.]|jgi:hypothetical protein|uniref:hypothetical protein n=1 Tax=Parvibaculum sp. TaxID=2024848 RepID=UPI000C924E9F|nr:hypothetical protein [Parvibaculum sp.]MAB15161.1 hypothetical protein [Parvibaculum sp.]
MSENDLIKASQKGETRILKVPSIAKRKLGQDITDPVRLDPRVLEKMQDTIKSLESKYAEALSEQVTRLIELSDPAANGDARSAADLYTIAHDIRGLAGTFGRPLVGRFANLLCTYIEGHDNIGPLENSIIRFHVEAIREALKNPDSDPNLASETLRALENLIMATMNQTRLAAG